MQPFSKITLQRRKGYREVFIYYSRHGAKFRESTRVKIPDRDIIDFEGTLTENTNFETIRKTHRQAEDLILAYIREHNEKPSVQWLRIEFDKVKVRNLLFPDAQTDTPVTGQHVTETFACVKTECKPQSIEEDLFFHWEDFLSMKSQTTRNEGTIKRYNNLISTLRKFKERQGNKGYGMIGLNSLSQRFFYDLLYYMVKEHEYVRATRATNSNIVNLPEIGLSNETAIKRLTDLTEYLSFCKKRKNVIIDLEEIREYIKIAKHKLGVIKQCDSKKWELTLTTEELQFTINLDYFETDFYKSLSNVQKHYLDIFIFMCLQGTAPIDTKKIKETDIVRGKLVGYRRKTRNGFKVELDPVSEQILIHHNYDLSFVDQPFNEALKKMFVTIFELYRPYFEDKYDEEYQLIYTQRKSKGDEEFLLMLHKGLFVEGMTGRRTFITNLNEESNEISMRENMRRTGHSRIQTHLGYQKDRQTGKNSKRRSLFGVSKINQSKSQGEEKPRLRKKRRQRAVLDRIVM